MTMGCGRTLVVAFGNDILGDDGAALEAAQRLQQCLPDSADLVTLAESPIALLDYMPGYARTLLLDTIMTGEVPPGTVHELRPEDFDKVVAPCIHFAGLPEILLLAQGLEIPFPQEIRILALEIEQPYEFGEVLSPSVAAALADFVDRAATILDRWHQDSELIGSVELRAEPQLTEVRV